MRYLITGSTGLLGNEFVKKLNEKNNQIKCLIHTQKSQFSNNKNILKVHGDLLDYSTLISASKSVDIIIHCAAVINVKKNTDYYLINTQGTSNLIKVAETSKVKQFIYISSWAVDPKGGDYSNSKLQAETEIRKYPNYLIIRPSDIYSKTKSHLINFIKSLSSYPIIPIIGDGNYKVSPIFVDDLVNSVLFLMKNKGNTTNTILGPKVYTFNEFTQLILKTLNLKKPIIHIDKLISYPIIFLADKFGIPLPLNIEKFRRLTSEKIEKNVFDFRIARIKPLYFEKALLELLIKN